MKQVVLASRNSKKLAEMQALLAPLNWQLRLVSDFTEDAAEESAPTFIENCLLKARHAARVSGLPAIADDSGLEVDALEGQPGVQSARFAGWQDDCLASEARESSERPATDGRAGGEKRMGSRAMDGWTQADRDRANNDKLLRLLDNAADERRDARFVCVMAFLRGADDPVPLFAQGLWHGRILRQPRGANGFGYDPLFFVPTHNCSSAELEPAVKNGISHRAQAAAQLLEALRG